MKCLSSPYLKTFLLIDSRVGRVKDFGCAFYELHAEDSRLTYLIGRNLNPFFALAEFAWLINGSNALKPLQFFIKAYGQFSDDGETLNGAYGFRLRHYFGCDQIEAASNSYGTIPTSRRVVLTLWSADRFSGKFQRFALQHCGLSEDQK